MKSVLSFSYKMCCGKKRLCCVGMVSLVVVSVYCCITIFGIDHKPSKRDFNFCPTVSWLSYLFWSSSFHKETKILKDTVFGIYILVHADLMESGQVRTQWKILDSSIAAECANIGQIHVRLLLDKKNPQTTEKLKMLIKEDFNGTVVGCQKHGSIVDLDIQEIKELYKDTRTLTATMTDDYIFRNTSHFHVVFLDKARCSNVFPDLWRMLLHGNPDQVGMVTDRDPKSKELSGVFLSKIHFEIFGWFLPPYLTDVKLAVAYMMNIYPPKMAFSLEQVVNDNGVDTLRNRKLSWLSNTEMETMRLERDTLDRYLKARRSSPCFRCFNVTSRKVISMSLYGGNRRYTIGAIRNAQLFPVTFPGWKLWFYVERQPEGAPLKHPRVPAAILRKVQELGAEIRYIEINGTGLAPMLWRFTIAEDTSVDTFIVRDCDSRLTTRDSTAVSEWLKTDKVFHCIRDHPSHSRHPVSGGLWGARRKRFVEIFGEGRLGHLMRPYGAGYIQDMKFLGSDVWPKVTSVAYCHDSYSCKKFPASHPFPVPRIGQEHVGQVYNEFSIGREDDMGTISRTPVNTDCVSANRTNIISATQ